MQRKLLLMRHAKSNWAVPNQPDYERTLNARGVSASVLMAERLVLAKVNIDTIITSTAVRASQTAYIISQHLGIEDLIYRSELYHAPPATINEVIYSLDNNIKSALIVCHNPGITDWANNQCGVITSNMPTASIVAISFESDDWHNYDNATKKLIFYDKPKRDIVV